MYDKILFKLSAYAEIHRAINLIMGNILTKLLELSPLIGVMALMISLGLGLTIKDLTYALTRPKSMAVGLIGQLIMAPVVAFIICMIFSLPPYIAVGLMIISACPGGATSNAFTVMARGDVALSVSLSAISSLVIFFTLPLIVNLSVEYFLDGEGAVKLSFLDSAVRIFTTTALPIAIGMIMHRFVPSMSKPLEKPLYYLGFALLLLPAFSFFAEFGPMLKSGGALAACSAILLNVSMMVLTYGVAAMLGLSGQLRRTLSLEVGIQNFGLVLVIIVTFIGDMRMILPALLYLPSMFITATIVGRMGRNEKESNNALPASA
jgi:bile acid:Na+ symporter, BASS family